MWKQASARLLASDETVVAIASSIGYRSSSSFSGAWRRLTGYTPGKWTHQTKRERERVTRLMHKQLD